MAYTESWSERQMGRKDEFGNAYGKSKNTYIHTHIYIYICLDHGLVQYLYLCRVWTGRRSEGWGKRCPVHLSNSRGVSLIQRILMTLVLRLIMNGGFSFDMANRVFRVLPGFMGKSLVIAVRSSTKRNNKTRSCT